MTTAVASTTHPAHTTEVQQHVPAKSASSTQKAAQTSPQSAPDTVKISNAARAVVQEALETGAQTAKEAAGGDSQAQRLIAKQAAASKIAKG